MNSRLKLLCIASVAALALVPLPRPAVERFYSSGVYPRLQSLVTSLSNRAPFSVGDLLGVLAAVGLAAWWGATLYRTERGRRTRSLGRLGLDTLALAAVGYALFLGLWGLNYLRQPLPSRIDYDQSRVTRERGRELARLTVENLNAEAGAAHARPWPSHDDQRRALEGPFAEALAAIGSKPMPVTAAPKRSVFEGVLAASGVDGFTNPFSHEVVLLSDLLPVERPFLLAHEWGHVAGLADDAEANFLALVACSRAADPVVRYSGWLALFHHLPRGDLQGLPRLAPAVVGDLRAVYERATRRYKPAVGRAQAAVYDRFLKVHHVEEGIGSYALVVRLVLGSRDLVRTSSSSSPTR